MPIQQPGIFLPFGQMNLIINFRKLWLELAIWTRAYIISIITQMGNTDAISERLFSAPVDFGQILALIFGEENSERFINLLSTHIIAMEALFNAQKNGDEQLVNDNAIRIYENADEIASFLLQINPFWNQAQWRNLLYNYIDMTFQQSIALLTRNFHQDIDVFDRISYHTVLMGDYMANGIIQYLAIRGT